MISISDARITFIMGECFTAHLADDTFDFPVLWDEWMYAYLYNQLRGGAHGPYALPWRDSQKSAFWRHYLGDSPGSVPPEQAWEKFVPLRLIFDASDIGTDLGERVLIDAFGFPFGVVVAITVHVAKGVTMTMDDWIARLRTLRLGTAFAEGARPLSLDSVSAALLDRVRNTYYLGVQPGTRSAEPLSINTVLQAAGGEPAKPISRDLQRQLHAVTAWPADWGNVPLPAAGPPAFMPMRSRNKVAGDVHYSVGRGRTIWRPGLFARHTAQDGPQRRHTLSCLAHNLVAGGVQAEMLRLFAVRLAAVEKTRRDIDKATVRRLSRIADQLRRGENTFRSTSVRQQLEDPSSRAAVNALLQESHASIIE